MQDNKEKNVLSYESTLPEDFDGTFHFTNSSKEEFVGVWGGKEYHFPPESTSQMVIPEHTPLEVQHIRKKFAKDYAEREFYKSKGYKVMSNQEGKPGNRTFSSIHQAPTYTLKDLEPFIQSCLRPLPVSKMTSKVAPKAKLEDKLTKDEDGSLVTEAIDKKTSLRQKALNS